MFFTCISMSGFALEFDKPIAAQVILNQQGNLAATTTTKFVQLMNLKLTQAERRQFTTFHSFNPDQFRSSDDLPTKVELGMNNTPVLDQGQHGSCVTFANTAALDALIGKGDYVSQLCSLAVGSYMSEYGYFPSGWEGSLGGMVVNQLLQLGIIDKATQRSKTCGGLSEYPLDAAEVGKPMSLEEYKALSINLNQNIWYRPIMTVSDRLSWGTWAEGFGLAPETADILKRVKESLAKKPYPLDLKSAGRLTFAVLLPVDFCSAGACGSNKAHFDTWVLSDAMKKMTEGTLAGHEMVITGYDDEATVTDEDGQIHKGLLKLRNSWGTKAGDQGDYYMTYEFFCQFVLEVQQLIWISGPEK